jgi:hypothetical protein
MDKPVLTEEDLTEENLRKQYPQMFEHLELRPGEVWLGSEVVDVVYLNAEIYRRNGTPSARVGNPYFDKLKGLYGEFEFHPIFVKLSEFIAVHKKMLEEKRS